MFDRVADGVSAALWGLEPSSAVAFGMHHYDGTVPEPGEEALDARLGRLRLLGDRLAPPAGLDPAAAFDALVLRAAADRALFDWGPGGPRRRDPWSSAAPFDVRPYLARPYAPFGHRAEAAAALLDAAPEVLDAPVDGVPAPVLRRAVRRVGEAAWWLEHGLPARVRGAEDRAAAAALVESAQRAAAALGSYWARLEEALPSALPEAALGEPALQAMLTDGEALGIEVGEVRAGVGDPVAAAPAEEHPVTVEEVRGLLAALESAAGAVAPLPPGAGVRAEEEPLPEGRVVAVDVPGPLEEGERTVRCGVRPGAAASPAALRALLAREVFPGRALQALHHSAAPSEPLRRTASPAFTAGWAAYAAGLAGPDPLRVLDDARLLAVVEIHADRLPVGDAARRLAARAGLGEPAAAAEADACAADPWRWSAALGRRRIAACVEGGLSHDEILSHGAPPIGLLGREDL
ncbi:MAG: hypothetical protein KQH83_02940 [Actinobacteria bacterium]|nr:hypothetical protein [Actinomycetota bacterium]